MKEPIIYKSTKCFADYCRQNIANIDEYHVVTESNRYAPIPGAYANGNGVDVRDYSFRQTEKFFDGLPVGELVFVNRKKKSEVWVRSPKGFFFLKEKNR